jgi:hypothetical protein
VHDVRVPTERPWDEEAAGMPDPYLQLRPRGFSPYGPEGEIFQMDGFASGVRRASGWRRVVGVGVASLILVAFLGSAVVSVMDLADGGRVKPIGTSITHLP